MAAVSALLRIDRSNGLVPMKTGKIFSMTPEAVAAIVRLSASLNTISWLTPMDVSGCRAEVAAAVRSGRDAISAWSFPDVDLRARIALATAARAATDRLEPRGLDRALITLIDEAEAVLRIVRRRDDTETVVWSERRYGSPSADDRDLAAKAFNEAPSDMGGEEEILDAAEVADRARAALDAYDLDQWSVVVDNAMAANMAVKAVSKVVKVSGSIAATPTEWRRLVAHEIGGHALRAENAARQTDPRCLLALGDAMPTEEGLAAWIEEYLGTAHPGVVRRYAARTLAVGWAAEAGIVEVARRLSEVLPLGEAAAIAVRVKRGLVDPNRPGAFSKDAGYWIGLNKVRRHLAAQPDDLALLMATRWSIELLPEARMAVGEQSSKRALLMPKPEPLSLP
ncbi:tyrosine/phenylalanine carboxypeptidase domain-containing protein [Rathayibacter sp. PhB152]|uniref:tyrosine/phenylalanine carboxypeptidase domain-containing protein n=1 Tax=Rathayibacter sp. PhB152 TaxID=2485190 RepID=UPI0011CE0E89|nr:tyrosine/phenylalanine carboxypeptidase domain-containing protein [Rathayibacter sp. PhB152]